MQLTSVLGLLAALLLSASAHALSSNADLEVLQVRATGGAASLSPAFSRESTEYGVRVNSGVTTLPVRAGAWVSAGKVTVNQENSPI
jgi:hypothetical protein